MNPSCIVSVASRCGVNGVRRLARNTCHGYKDPSEVFTDDNSEKVCGLQCHHGAHAGVIAASSSKGLTFISGKALANTCLKITETALRTHVVLPAQSRGDRLTTRQFHKGNNNNNTMYSSYRKRTSAPQRGRVDELVRGQKRRRGYCPFRSCGVANR